MAGGKKAAQTNISKYGKNFYIDIGRKGGQNGHTGGFASNPELASRAGAMGGRKSKRGKALKEQLDKHADDIIGMRNNGASIRQIALQYKVAGCTIKRWLENYGKEFVK